MIQTDTFLFNDLKADLGIYCDVASEDLAKQDPAYKAFAIAAFSLAPFTDIRREWNTVINAADCIEALEKVKNLFNTEWCQFKEEMAPEAFMQSVKNGFETSCTSQVFDSYSLMTAGLCLVGAAICAYGIWKRCQSNTQCPLENQ